MRDLSSAFLVGALAAGCLIAGSASAQQTINYVTAGGVYLENIKKAYLEPVGKKLNVQFNVETSDVDTPVRVQFKSGVVTFDLVEFGADQCARGAADGMYDKLDFSIIDKTDLLPGSFSDYYVGSTIYAVVPAWNTKKFGTDGPQNWADVWNVDKFPGSRSFTKHPRYTLEAALLADGVTPDKLYPMDLDRAFASLKKIKPQVKVWWESGAQSTQLMKDGVVDVSSMFNARAESAIAAGGAVAYTFNQGIMNAGCWAIPKGAPHKALAMQVLAEFVKPEYQAHMTVYSNYGYSNRKAGELGIIPPEVIAKLPTSSENIKKTVWMNFDWWAKNGNEALELFDQFLTSN
jgi:putative spermidine/putrescine transport system substrate-binding protein